MRIGIDFDNTIVCYDQLFWKLARDRGVISETVPRRKESIRDELRQRGREPIWTSLQGEAYGTRILEATPFDGVLSAFQEFHRRNWTVFIISHKTRTPIAGSDVDLHLAARNWLDDRGFLDESRTGLTGDRVFFELTKRDKLQRIVNLSCEVFIDDLPELLSDADFPREVKRILFDCHKQIDPPKGIRPLHSWNDAVSVLTESGR